MTTQVWSFIQRPVWFETWAESGKRLDKKGRLDYVLIKNLENIDSLQCQI
jgi:hypothetical protein